MPTNPAYDLQLCLIWQSAAAAWFAASIIAGNGITMVCLHSKQVIKNSSTLICRLLALFQRKIRPRIYQESAFLSLPLIVILMVCDELELPYQILLSQTCQGLWYILRDRCRQAMREADPPQRTECLMVLGDWLPDQRACTYCGTIHDVDYQDIPVTPYWDHEIYYKPCPAPEWKWDRCRCMPYSPSHFVTYSW